MFQKLAIVGVGLIGGSFGQWARQNRVAREVVGVARREETLVEAVACDCVDWATADLLHACTGADFVFLASPVGQIPAICAQIAPVLAPGCLVTDGGSTKGFVAQCEAIFGEKAHFIGGHPMAGGEKSGPCAARPDLFAGATWILTPTSKSDATALQKLRVLLEKTGAKLLETSPQTHDELVAVASHLPHVCAAALVHCPRETQENAPQIEQIVASGWRDSTRIAEGNPEMWRDISRQNRAALLDSLEKFAAHLEEFRAILRGDDAAKIEEWFRVAADERRRF